VRKGAYTTPKRKEEQQLRLRIESTTSPTNVWRQEGNRKAGSEWKKKEKKHLAQGDSKRESMLAIQKTSKTRERKGRIRQRGYHERVRCCKGERAIARTLWQGSPDQKQTQENKVEIRELRSDVPRSKRTVKACRDDSARTTSRGRLGPAHERGVGKTKGGVQRILANPRTGGAQPVKWENGEPACHG